MVDAELEAFVEDTIEKIGDEKITCNGECIAHGEPAQKRQASLDQTVDIGRELHNALLKISRYENWMAQAYELLKNPVYIVQFQDDGTTLCQPVDAGFTARSLAVAQQCPTLTENI